MRLPVYRKSLNFRSMRIAAMRQPCVSFFMTKNTGVFTAPTGITTQDYLAKTESILGDRFGRDARDPKRYHDTLQRTSRH
jgi:hypothetical protein